MKILTPQLKEYLATHSFDVMRNTPISTESSAKKTLSLLLAEYGQPVTAVNEDDAITFTWLVDESSITDTDVILHVLVMPTTFIGGSYSIQEIV
jgi:hypothetical protein